MLIIVGALWFKPCLYIGFAMLGLYVLLCLVSAIRMQRLMSRLSDADPEFGEMLNSLSEDPRGFVSERMKEQDEYNERHGEALLELSDDELFEAVYFQNLEIAANAEDSEVDAFSGARKTVYVLGMFDSEIQNGGLCQFFVNSSRETAPFVSESLEAVSAEQHRKLFEEFVDANGIDLSDLSSFRVWSRWGYIKQTKRFDFDAFDDRYYALPALQELVTDYIRANVTEF